MSEEMSRESKDGAINAKSARRLAAGNGGICAAGKPTFYHRVGKRWFDAIAAAGGLLATFPLLLVCAVAVRLDSPGPIFFCQRRVGKHGKFFTIIKFRTMIRQAEARGLKLTVDGDSRVTCVGQWLRKLKLDELPQLLNVLKGEMSLVGPRPEVEKYVAGYDARQMKVLELKPGITGPAALTYIDEATVLAAAADRDAFYRDTLLPRKLELDLAYGQQVSFRTDLRLILATLRKLSESSKGSAPVNTSI